MSELNADPKSDAERALLHLVERWQETYNTGAVDRMLLDCYAPDALVQFTGGETRGRDQHLKLEEAILSACPGRHMRINRVQFSGGDTAIVEAVMYDKARPDFATPFCAIHVVRDGKIVEDRIYLEAHIWPGIEAGASLITPGGVGRAV